MSLIHSLPAELRQPHPVLPLPSEAALKRAIAAGPADYEAFLAMLRERAERIALEKADPFRHGYEPPLWKILDALCGLPWLDHPMDVIHAESDDTRRAQMLADKAWCLQVRRQLLKREAPVKVLLLQGGNRAGKSEWAASRVVKILFFYAGEHAWCFHQNERMSIDYQQALIAKYLPAELMTTKAIRTKTTYLSYQKQNGFPNKKFTLPNLTDCVFNTYEQDKKTIEGGELKVVWPDELVPRSWVQELLNRIATRSGWMFITFTPKEGYSPTVKMFLDVARKTVESTAFVLPEDGGEPRLDLALQGENPLAWIEADPNGGRAQPSVPEGRRFAKVPRILTIDDQRSAVAYFHCFDNPYGNPAELYALNSAAPAARRKMVFYGLAEKAVAGLFPKFNPAVHVIAPEQIPATGTAYMICDPCSGRNWAMGWARVVNAPAGRTIYFYREWPCPGAYVPGVGDMGVWAESGEKHDGERGPAQASLGWGLKRYAQELARLEGRADWERMGDDEGPAGQSFRWDEDDEPEARRSANPKAHAANPKSEQIYQRIMDSRAAAMPTQTREGSTTLLEQMGETDIEPPFEPASGGAYADDRNVHWVQLINDLLDYDADAPLDPVGNQPRLFVSSECKNLIFALQNWTGEDGLKGACRDFVNLLQYLVLAEPEDFSRGATARGVRTAA